MSNELITGKASNVDLEALHGKVARVYTKAVDNMFSKLKASEESTDKDLEFFLDKDDIAILKGAQSFLKENDVRMEFVKKSGSRQLRSKIGEQLKNKRLELELSN